MSYILIKNAKIANEGQVVESDLLIKGERIDKIASDINASQYPDVQVYDAQGKLLLPGMIDDQVHFREPGLTHKGSIATESAAAIAGGITSFMEMPNVNPLTITHETLADKFALAATKSLANFSFYLGASNDNIEIIKSLKPDAACGVKVFMGASTGNMLVDNPDTLEDIFAHSPVIVATHCEDTPTITANEKIFREKYGEDVPMACHPLIRSEQACYLSSSLAVKLAQKHGTQLHVLHLTTARELELFTTKPLKDKSITAEVCVHHLFFNENDYADKGALIKCNPAIKTVQDQQALIAALNQGKLDIIATDHAPHTWQEKQGKYFSAPSGLPLVQHALLALFELMHDDKLSVNTIVSGTSHRVADRFQVQDRGYIREGYFADLVLIDSGNGFTMDREQVLSKCGWSPFDGYPFRSKICSTWVNGQQMWDGQTIISRQTGQKLSFNR
ncbi:MAG TPA: dihydroorotase [Aeromonadales bacterium]|nr:dihydroorotase [Aeromonadales bacterium]